MKQNKTICGVVYNPAADKCFYAETNNGSYLNGERINTSSSNTLSDSLLATGFPYIHDNRFDLSFFTMISNHRICGNVTDRHAN